MSLLVGFVGLFYVFSAESGIFPGDPPLADLALEGAVAGWLFVLIGYFVFLCVRSGGDRIVQLWRRVVPWAVGWSVLLMLPVLVRVGERQFGDWRQLGNVLRASEAEIRAFVRPRQEMLSDEELALGRAWFQTHPVYFKFKSEELTVRIGLVSAMPPYVGVDFGGGRRAVFEPLTMVCVYSD
ncbi:hypothetical protein [Corallococcus carmarthensis]|uniref:hypothetical protein n=1 Tax=Corallococcus carmarthensis TaxID=2316728 RepID=UPI00148D9207|nr:hypothetical protein [Corallococcus carmarthensis]NOK22487.1 hypothetical protein [Corallococcus carmarthensis]